MNLGESRPLWRFKRHIITIYIAIIAAVLLAALIVIFRTQETNSTPQFVWLLVALIFLVIGILIFSKISKILNEFLENSKKFDKIFGLLEKNSSILSQISQNTRLSETAKAIAFRDADRQSLREAVFDKLQQHDFDTTHEIINEIAHRPEYKQLTEQLRAQAKKYQEATDQERINQVIEHIEKLFENYDWAKASIQVERLIKTYPKSEKAIELRQKLLDRKQERKKVLLTAWDDAVKRQATDRSLGILRELDLYLTPNEGLALQEAAGSIFRNKLHNLGVQFSLAVSGKQWDKAIKTGEEIIRDFPNSRMTQEIRERWDILKQKAK